MIDLHMHTKYSDGEKSLIQMLELAQNERLEYISITDHDVIDAYKELQKIDLKKYYNGKIINGVEFKVSYQNYTLELLGYNYDIEKLKRSKWVDKETKIKKHEIMLEHLKNVIKEIGLKFNYDIKLNQTGFADHTAYFEFVSYPENIVKLEELGIDVEAGTGPFYRNFIGDSNSIFYFDESRYQLTLEEAVKLIHESGGLAFLAHPLGVYNVKNPKETINQIIDLKLLDGLECKHRTISSENSEYLINLCREHKLLMSGGSDFHRENKDRFSYVNFGTEQIPVEFIKDLLDKINM